MSRTCPECNNTYDDEVLHCPEDGLNLSTIPPVDELIGRTIGSYRVEKLLGKGGMGAVYMGVHPVIGSRVAIKFLHPQYGHDEKIVERFFNEARAVNVIGHDNILKILDLNVTDDNRHYFVMEFLHGRALQALITAGKAIPLEVTGPILLQICNALQAAHGKGIVHRDLKPDNIYLITLNGKKHYVKVVDFGIARVNDDAGVSTGKTQTGMVMGTPAYMSPEQGSGATGNIDGRSDVYSLGVMMYQLATGRLPFPGTNFGEVLIGHLQKTPPAPRTINPSIPEAYEAVILKCLEKSQDARYQTMTELHDAILGVMESLGISKELPRADGVGDPELTAIDAKLPSSPGARTPSRPGRTAPGAARPPSRPGVRNSNPNVRASNSQVAARRSLPPQDRTVLAPQPPPKSHAPVFIGIGVAVVIVLGAVGFLLYRDQQLIRTAVPPHVAATTPSPPPAVKNPPPASVFVSVVTDPLDAEIAATWEGGEKRGAAPMSLELPKDAKVHLAFSKTGFLPYEMDVIADRAQTVNAKLKAEKVATPVETADTAPKAPKKSGTSKSADKKRDKTPVSNDGLIDIGDALK